MRALIYTRVSDDRAHGRSVQEQEAEARAVCEREGWELVEVVTDSQGASRHSKGDRLGWRRARKLVEAGDVDVLVTWEASRAQRDLKAYAELRDLCVGTETLWCYSGRVYDLSSSDDRFRTGVDALFAEREADDTADRVKRAMRANAAKGRPHGRRLYGYRRVHDPKTGVFVEQVPEPEEATIVRLIFTDFLLGNSQASIATELRRQGVTTGTGRQWTGIAVNRALRNPAYAGRRVHQGEVVGEAVWEPLVSADVFDRVQARLDELGSRNVSRARTSRLLSGVARCGKCGGKMAVGHDRKRRKVYQCRETFDVVRDQVKLDAYVTRLLLERLARPDAAEALEGAPDPTLAAEQERIADLRARLDDAVHEFTTGNLSAGTLAKIEGDLLTQITEAERNLRRTAIPLDIDIPTEGLDEWWRDELDPKTRRALVGAFITAITVNPTQRGRRTLDPDAIEIDWRF